MPGKTSYYVVLDANILIQDIWMQGASFSYLRTHRFLGHKPAIPEIVVLEAKNWLRSRAEELVSHVGPDGVRSAGNLRRLTRLFSHLQNDPELAWDVDEMIERWEGKIFGLLDEQDGVLIQVPDVEVGDLTKRSIEARRPFSRGDRGFRDTLIWLSTLELISRDSRVSFVTANTHDFFAPDALEPHPDIASEAEERIEGDWRMLFHRSLDDFITRFDSNREASAEALRRALISNAFSGLDVWKFHVDGLATLFYGGDVLDEIRWTGFPYQVEAPVLNDVEEVVGLDIGRVDHVKDDIYRVFCDVAFIGNFEGSIGYTAGELVIHPKQNLWQNETDAFWTEVGLRAVGTVITALDVDVRASSVVAFRALPLEHWEAYAAAVAELDALEEDPFLAPPFEFGSPD